MITFPVVASLRIQRLVYYITNRTGCSIGFDLERLLLHILPIRQDEQHPPYAVACFATSYVNAF